MNASSHKALRTVLLAVLFHTYWPRHLARGEITTLLSPLYGDNPIPALYRDLATLTGTRVEDLPRPDEPGLAEWMAEQQRQRLLAITYDRQEGTFGLEQSLLSIEITEDEVRAFVALQEGFTPGVPYAKAMQNILPHVNERPFLTFMVPLFLILLGGLMFASGTLQLIAGIAYGIVIGFIGVCWLIWALVSSFKETFFKS